MQGSNFLFGIPPIYGTDRSKSAGIAETMQPEVSKWEGKWLALLEFHPNPAHFAPDHPAGAA
jgi:hypothetical protein